MFPKPNELISSSLLLQAPTIVYIYPHQIGPPSPISPDQIGMALTYQIAYQACAKLLRVHGYHGSSSHDSHRNSSMIINHQAQVVISCSSSCSSSSMRSSPLGCGLQYLPSQTLLTFLTLKGGIHPAHSTQPLAFQLPYEAPQTHF